MKVDDDVFDKMIKSLKKALSSFTSRKRKARKYVRYFMIGMSDADREFIVKEILHQQNRSLVNAIANKKNIALPGIGSFQYRESLEIIRNIKNEVKAEHGIKDLRKVDEETFDKIHEEIEVKKKAIILPLYFKQLGGKGSQVNHNFLNGTKKNSIL